MVGVAEVVERTKGMASAASQGKLSGDALNPTADVLPPEKRREEYDRLVKFGALVSAHHDRYFANQPLRVRPQKTKYEGLGLVATDDIPKGQTIVWYGGPFVPLKTASPTHSLPTADPSENLEDLLAKGRDIPLAHVIDGEVVSAFYQDTLVTSAEREAVLIIAGSLMDSSQGPSATDTNDTYEVPASAVEGKGVRDRIFQSVDGIQYGAVRFVAPRDIRKGDELLYFYFFTSVHRKPRNPLAFRDPRASEHVAPMPSSSSGKRRVTSAPNNPLPTPPKRELTFAERAALFYAANPDQDPRKKKRKGGKGAKTGSAVGGGLPNLSRLCL